MITKKVRWVLNGNTIHIQIKGPAANRSYGMAVDIPFTRLWPGTELPTERGDCKSRAGTGRRYTRGTLSAGRWLRFDSNPTEPCIGPIVFTESADLALANVLAYVKANGKEVDEA